MAAVSLACLVLFAVAASSAGAAPMGITGYFGNPGTTSAFTGGLFGTIGANTSPRGVAVRDSTGDVYVADTQNNRVQRFDSLGVFVSAWGRDVVVPGGVGDTSEIQSVTVGGGASGGGFTLSFGAVAPTTTDAIAFGATAATVDAALEALGGIGAGGVAVTGSAGGPYTVEFTGARASVDQAQMTSSAAGLTPAGTVAVATSQDGASFEVCTVAAQCKAGTVSTGVGNPTAATSLGNGGTLNAPQGVAVNQTTGDLYVTNQAYRRIEQYEPDGGFVRSWGADVVISGAGQSSEVQTVTVTATGGRFTLTFNAQTTVSLPYDAPAVDPGTPGVPDSVEEALNALSTVGGVGGSVAVTGGPGGETGSAPYGIVFGGSLAGTDVGQVSAASAVAPDALTGGSPASGVTTATQNGGATGFEICNTASSCKTGAAGTNPVSAFGAAVGYPAVVPVGANAGNVLVGDSNKRVSEFTAAGVFVRAWGWDVVLAGPDNTTINEFEVCRVAALNICKAGLRGGGLGQFNSATAGGFSPDRIAIDSAGGIYTVEATASFRVQKFTPSGSSLTPSLYCPSVGSGTLCGTAATDTPTDVAVDTNGDLNPSNDHLYVAKAFPAGTGTPAATAAERRVLEFDSLGLLVETHLANSGLNSVNGFALKAGGQSGYLTSATPQAGFYEIGIATPPTVTIEPTTDVTATCATLNGAINPNGGGSLTTAYRFEYSANGGDSWSQIPAPPIDIGNGTDPVAVQQNPCGLEPNTDYLVRLVAIKGGESTNSTGNEGDFTTDPAPPSDVQTFPAYWDTSTDELVLRGSVNPNNTQTSYWFEYGTEPCSTSDCTSVPLGEDAPAGSAGQQVDVSQRVAALDRDTTYHYRIVADNGVGAPVQGPGREFTTPVGDPDCANEQLREENGSTGLPDCRAFEWVSNGNSWGAGVTNLNAVSPDGDRVQLNPLIAFNDPDSTPGLAMPYTALRGDGRWVVRSALPPGDRASAGGLIATYWTSPDLSMNLWPGNTQGQGYRGEVHWLIENIDGSSTEAHEPLIPLTRTGPATDLDYQWPVIGATSDLSTFIFRPSGRLANTGEAFFPDEPLLTGNNTSLYMISGAGGPDPTFELVNRATDPLSGVPGTPIGGACGATGHGISEDGDVVYFSARPTAPSGTTCVAIGNPRRLYKRVNGAETVAIGSPAVPGGDDSYQGSSEDGSIVFFTSPRQLTGSDTDATNDLYLYDEDPPAGQPSLVQVSAGEVVAGDHPTVGVGAEVISVVGPTVPADGSRVYFTARGRLVPGAVKDEVNLYVYERSDDHEDGRIGLVATLDSGSGTFIPAPDRDGGDGRFLVFATATGVLGEDTDSSSDVYRYDDETGELVCVSCMGSGSFDVVIGGQPVSDDGSAITFSTREGLAQDDLNGVGDVYLWRDGMLALLSQGTGQFGTPADDFVFRRSLISGDGESVYFMTEAPLYAADTNNARDIYVARVGGGFPAPVAKAVCGIGEECQGAGSGAPGASSPDGSVSTGNARSEGRVRLGLGGLSAAQRRRAARSGGLSIRVRLDRPGLVRVVARGRIGKKTRRVGAGSKQLSKPGAATVRVGLNRAARKQLGRGRKLRLSIEARSTGARPRSVQVVLRRAGR